MVKTIEKNNKKYFQCEICGFVYKTKELAQKCEVWCEKYKSCNVEITKYAVSLE
ncbi:hypothetical protein J4458_00560 [Candidatus Woesearchaeota archaeon]|nr:hypothetical protein [Candidatus Woesearchaeota archaeon]